MGSGPHHTAKEVIEAIQGTMGVKAQIARKLDVTWGTVQNYLERWVTVREAYNAEVERSSDMAETVLLKAIQDGDIGAAKWWLSRVRRGKFSTKQLQEISGPDGGPVIVVDWEHDAPDDPD